jgi:asparagine synthase (glutamine-hydrolysing)
LVTLGHRRLAILDLTEDGRQPMLTDDAQLAIVFNGEIYNFVELRDALRKAGHVFRSESDTEVVLHAYRQWGSDCLHRFDGMWAFAIWDQSRRRLFLARDRFGKKPLFYAWVGGTVVFASEMKAIVPFLPDCRPSRHFAWMRAHIHEYESSEEAVIEGIKRVPAGHHATVEGGTMRVTRYWDTLEHLPVVPSRYEEQVERFRELFVDSCRLRLRADVSVGTSVSGGMDSTAVLAGVARAAAQGGSRLSGDWQHAFTVAFAGTGADESDLARQVAARVGVPLTRIEALPQGSLDGIEDAMYLQEDLYITSPVPIMSVYAAMRREGVVVSLDGHGGDELLTGYNESPMTAYPDCRSLSDVLNLIEVMRGMYGSDYAGQRGVGWYLRDYAWRFRMRPAWMRMRAAVPRSVVRCLRGAQCRPSEPVSESAPADVAARVRHPAFESSLDHLGRHLYILFHETTLPTLLRNYDRYAMAHGVEVRMPFLDHRLVAFCMALPWRSKIRGGFGKAILRDAARPWLPSSVVNRRIKIGFGAPAVEWLRSLRGPILDIVGSSGFLSCEVIPEAKLVRPRIEASVEKGDFRSAESAWTDVLTYFWYRAMIERGRHARSVVVSRHG